MSPSPSSPRRRVLVVGIDGVRLDLLRAVPTPHLDAVADAGFLGRIEIDEATPTMSGPCWTTIATGVGVAKHGVYGNHFGGNRLDVFPDFATRLAQEDGRKTFVAGGWEPLFLARQGGPLFAAPGRLSYIAPRADTSEDWDACDDQVTDDAVRVLATDDPEVSFVYLGAVDETGHLLGCGSAYLRAIERADERLGRLLTAVRSRPVYARESWTVIAVTDHGHRDEGGHGGRTPQERSAWVACCGPDIPARPPSRPLRFEDVAVQVYASLGRAADSHRTPDGSALSTPASAPLTPAPAGSPVMSLTVQSPGLACSWSAPLRVAAPGTVGLDPSSVTSGAPPTCSPGARSTLRLLPDGSLVRELENSASAPLTYRRR
ncbi:alkaline phosphatase family protein [Streptomyces sp. ICC4]|uniref:alkaline phosphatase family protein n=1 Tax=Streptomyces sp. ICC4 TaxID=2099584 RepID=UPI0031BA1469